MLKLTWNMLWVVLGAFLIAAVAYYSFTFITAPRIDIRKFSGNVLAVEGDIITLHGVFSGSGTIPESFLSERDFSFRVGGATRFEKTEIRWPTWAELAAQGTSGSFNIQNLPRTEGDGSLNDLKDLFLLNAERVYVQADFSASIHNSRNPTASSVFYQLMGIPPPLLSP